MNSVQQSMWEHRHQGKPLAALNQLLGRRKSGFEKHATNELLDHFVGRPADSPSYPGRPCLLLETARHRIQARLDPLGSSTASLDPFDLSRYEHLLKLLPGPRGVWFRERFSLRCDLIRLIRDLPGESTERVSRLASIVARYDQVFSPPSIPGTLPPGVLPQPAQGNPWWQTMLEQQFPNWGALFDELAASLVGKHAVPADGWSTGLCFVGETVAWLLGAADVPSSRFARASVLLVGSLDTANPRDGHLAELVVEAFPGGSGRVTPHPLYAGYLATDERFSGSLALAARELLRHAPGCQLDFRWTIRVHDPRDEARLSLPMNLSDASAGAAIYCALRAALEGDRLDGRSVVTAALRDTGYDARKRPRPVGLTPISGLLEKVTALREELHLTPGQRRDSFRNERVDRILVAPDQPWDGGQIPAAGVETPLHEWKVQIAPVNDLEQIYQSLTEYGRKALAVKRALASQATELLQGTCDRYIPPRLSRRPTDEEAHKLREQQALNPETSQHERESPRVPLSDTERNAVLMARSLPLQSTKWFRGLILADSGFGKSSLLLDVERTIAADETDLRIPIRLGAGPRSLVRDLESDNFDSFPPASEFDWSSFDALLSQLLLHLNPQLPDSAQLTVEDLRRIIARGDACFLIDAIDQTEQDFRLNTFFAEIKDCAVLTTGRPEIRDYREKVVDSTPWCVLKLEPFGEQDVVEYCPGGFGAALWRKKEWRDLITVPLLLKQLRYIGPVRLGLEPGAKQSWRINREWVYAETLDRLIVGNLRKLRDQSPDRAVWKGQSSSTISKILAESAWAMRSVVEDDELPVAERTRFAGRLTGDELKTFLDNCRKEQTVLLGTNLITTSFVEREVRGTTRTVGSLSFRHLSFWEWFCGQHLARLAAEKTTPDWGAPEPGVVEAFFRDHALKGDRPWVLRFALSAAARWAEEAATTKPPRPNDAARWNDAVRRMSRWLLAYGNPFLLTEAVEQDRVPLAEIDDNLDRLRLYLVFLEQFAKDWGGSKAETASWPEPPVFDKEIAACLARMFELERHDKDKKYRPLYRDGRWMPMAIRLLDETVGQALPDTSTRAAPSHPAADFSPASPTSDPPLAFPLKTDHVTDVDVQRLAEGELSPADFCRALRDQFLSEFENRVASYPRSGNDMAKRDWLRDHRALLQLVPEECRPEFALPFSLDRTATVNHDRDVTPVTDIDIATIRTWTPKAQLEGRRRFTARGIERDLTYRERRDRFNWKLNEYGVNWCLCPPQAWQHPYYTHHNPRDSTVTGVESPPDRRLPEQYWLGRTPVTNAQWETYDPYHRRTRRTEWSRSIQDPNDKTKFLFKDDLEDHPVIEVSWFDAMLFCRWLTGRGKFGRFQLPNDWEWEACARAGRDNPRDKFGIPWTNPATGQEHFDSLSSREANFNRDSAYGKAPPGPFLKGTCPVGGIPGAEYPANGFGLVDMHGQAWEWQRNPFESPETDREPERINGRCSVRGGSWNDDITFCRCFDRDGSVAGICNFFMSLRLART